MSKEQSMIQQSFITNCSLLISHWLLGFGDGEVACYFADFLQEIATARILRPYDDFEGHAGGRSGE